MKSLIAFVVSLLASTTLLAAWQPGLMGGYMSSTSLDRTQYPAVTNVYAGPIAATNRVGSTVASTECPPIWANNRTWVFWGAFKAEADGDYTFLKYIDDAVLLKIDGQVLIDDTSWNAYTRATVNLAAGWHTFELRLYNGSGGAGVSGDTSKDSEGRLCGFGLYRGASTSTAMSVYTYPEDPGDMSVFRHDDGLGFEDTLQIGGAPYDVPVPGVSYATIAGLSSGDTRSLSVPAGVQTVSDGVRATCTGWKLYTIDIETGVKTLWREGDTTELSDYVHPGTQAKLEWQWAVEYRVSASAQEGGVVTPAEAWVLRGASQTVMAEPADAEHAFYKWEGDLDDNSPTSSALSFVDVCGPKTLTARFGSVTNLTPSVSLADAVAAAVDGSTLELEPGTYTVASRLVIDKPIRLVGKGPAPDDVVIKPTSATAPAYIMTLSHDEARLENLTLAEGRTGSANNAAGAAAAALIVNAGTMSGCVVRDCTGAGYYGAVQMFGGLVENSTIRDNKMTRPGNAQGNGGGVTLAGGTLRNCLVSGNTANRSGAGICLASWNNLVDKALVQDCIVENNALVGDAGFGAGIAISGGTVERTIVRNNTGLANTDGCGISIHKTYGFGQNGNPVVRNCVVTGNKGLRAGAGVWMEIGTLVNTTISGNTSEAAEVGVGLKQTGGNSLYNIVYANANESDCQISGGTATGNVTTDPLFVDAANGDYSLRFGSPAIDAATPVSGVAVDLRGMARPQGAAPDCGAYEYAAEAGAVDFVVASDRLTWCETGSPALSVRIVGAEGKNVTYQWDFDNDGTVDSVEAEPMWTNVGLGTHAINLTVTVDGVAYTKTFPAVVDVRPTTAYVDAASTSPAYPYATPATAATTIQEAIDAVWVDAETPSKVVVKAGTYPCPALVTRVTVPVELVAEDGPSATFLQGWNNGDKKDRHRVLYVDHPQALVHGFTLENGRWDSFSNGDEGGAALWLLSGVVSNCVIRNSWGADNGGAVRQKGGLLTHSVLYGNQAYRGNNVGAGKGTAVYLTGGTLASCTLTNNWVAGNQTCGTVCNEGGTVTHCLIADNYGRNANSGALGLYQLSGLTESCVIRDNGTRETRYSKYGAGARLQGGTMRNCLVTGNLTYQNAAGVYIDGGATFEFNTVTANRSTSSSGSGIYVNKDSAVVRYNVIYGNGAGIAAEALSNLEFVKAKTFAANLVAPATDGTGNVDADPLFTDAAAGDYTLGVGSPAIDAVTDETTVETDLNDAVRPKDGDGDGVARCDWGCYEAAGPNEGPLRCSFTRSIESGYDSVDVTFVANVAGDGSTGSVTYTWDFGAGEVLSASADGAEQTVRFATYGVHAVSLTVSAGGSTAFAAISDCVSVGTRKIYVNTTGSGVWPYATPETATNDIVEVLSSALFVSGEIVDVEVADGDYPINGKWGLMSGAVVVHSVNGPSATSFYGNAPGEATRRAAFYLSNPDARLEGFTIRDCNWDGNLSGVQHACVKVTSGTIRNCVLTNLRGGNSYGGALTLEGGLAENLVIHSCEASGGSNPGVGIGGGAYVGGSAVLRNSVISNNYAVANTGGVLLDGERAVVSNCVIVANRAGMGLINYKNGVFNNDRHWGGVKVNAGTLANCTVADNFARNDFGGAQVTGKSGRIVNCLFTGNAALDATQALGMSAAGQVVNCTVAGNGTNAAPTGVSVKLTAGTFKNNIVWGNEDCAAELDAGSATVANCCYPNAPATNGNLAEDPLFRRPLRRDYRLRLRSKCLDAGDGSLWAGAEAACDLNGAPRVQKGLVDLGCYESGQDGMVILVR